MNALGKHLLLELKDCDKEVLDDISLLKGILLTAANKAGATVLAEHFHHFEPQGVSGVVVIAESHMFIHTWPEYGYAAADIFTCGNSVQPEKAAQIIIEKLGVKNYSIQEIPRGTLNTQSGLE